MEKLVVPNVLYIQLNGATREQFLKVITTIFEAYPDHPYRLNETYLEDRGLVYLKTTPVMYNLLRGLAEDGSERVRYDNDPKFVMPTEPLEEALKVLKTIKDWDEIDFQNEEIQARYKPKQIKVKLPPLITIPPFKPQSYLSFEKASIDPVDINIFKRNIICVTVLDPETRQATTAPIRNVQQYFKEYSSVSDYPKIKKAIVKIRLVKGGPLVDTESYFLHFDPNSRDAEHSMVMLHSATIINKHREYPLKIQFCNLRMYEQIHNLAYF